MTITKTYRSLVTINFSTTIGVGNSQVYIHFTGGRTHPKMVFGTYRTSDPSIIAALENHPKYGIDWVCESEKRMEVLISTKPGEVKVDDKMIVTGATNSQQAREWLNKNKGIPFTKMRNKGEVLAVAKEQKVEFINLLNS